MKKFFSTFRARQIQAGLFIGLSFTTAFGLAQRPLYSIKTGWQLPFADMAVEEAEEDGDEVFPDRPDLALQQDADLTRDPVTGRVPTERLRAAALFNETSRKSQAAQRTTAATLSNAPWVERGPNNVGGRILALLIEPTDASGNTVWAGSADGGLWKVTNATTGSYTWTNVNGYLSNLAVSTVAADPGTSIRYCGTGEGFFNSDAVRGNGIWKSSDTGATWTQLASTNNTNFNYVQKVLVHPVTHDVYAATRAGLWRSQNGGTTWTSVLSTANNAASDIEIAQDNTLFVSFGTIFNPDAIFRSPTGNAGSWTNLNTLGGSGLPTTGFERIELACAPSDASRVYALFQSSAGGRPLLNIYRSSDGGNTWVTLSRPGGGDFTNGQAWYNLAISVSPADANAVYVGGLDLWFTSDAGNATPGSIAWDQESVWSNPTSSVYYVHADHHAIAFVPTATAPANKAFFGSDGGLAYSADASISNATQPQFSQRNSGFNVTQFFAVAMHPSTTNFFLAGAQDNGTQRFTTAALNSTTQVTGGDGAFCAIDQDNPAVQFTSYIFNQYRRSLDGGNTFTNFNLSTTLGSFINPWEYDSPANILYACHNTDTYLAWTNAGDASAGTAITINPSLGAGAGKVTHIAVSPATANRIYVGTNAGNVLRVDNANTTTPTVTTLLSAGAGRSISCIALDPANENHQLVTLSNYNVVSVFESTNANAASPTWTNVEGNLPDMPVRWALFDPRNTTRAILATEMGVYTTVILNGASTSWSVVNNGPVNVRVDMLRYRTGDKLVAAATHGRGLFTSVIFDPSTPLPVTLTSLTAAREAKVAQLKWQTASEQNALRFEVERSANAVDFQRVGRVAAVGNSTSPQSYTFVDPSAGPDISYYRLKQVDSNGDFTFSPAVVLAALPATPGALLTSVYPNPFSTELNLELAQAPAGSIALTLVDAQGRRVWSANPVANSRQLRVALPAALARGTYLLTVKANGQQATRRVMKE